MSQNQSEKKAGYVLVLRHTHGGRRVPMLEPAFAGPENLALVGQSITLEDAIRAFGATKDELLAAHDRAHARKGVGPST